MEQPTRTRITADNYFQLPEYKEHTLIQLIDGEVIIGMAPIIKHQILVKKILILLNRLEEAMGGITLASPVEVKLDNQNVFEPDVLYIKDENLAIAQQDEKRIIGAPDLIVEVLSPSTAKYDRQQKYHAYEKNGVQEYWIVDPLHETIEIWTLDQSGKFQRQGVYGAGDTLASQTLDDTVDVTAIFDI